MSKKIGRPKLPKEKRRYNFTIALTHAERLLLERIFETVQNGVNKFIAYLLKREKKE